MSEECQELEAINCFAITEANRWEYSYRPSQLSG
jgi:hypothetical protein